MSRESVFLTLCLAPILGVTGGYANADPVVESRPGVARWQRDSLLNVARTPQALPLAQRVEATEEDTEGQERGHGEEWYGGQILVVDVVSVLLTPLGGAGLIPYLLGGPVVHLAHERGGTGLGSLALRTLTPIATGLVTEAIACSGNACDGDMGGIGAAIAFLFGAIPGALLAISLDVGLLAWQ